MSNLIEARIAARKQAAAKKQAAAPAAPAAAPAAPAAPAAAPAAAILAALGLTEAQIATFAALQAAPAAAPAAAPVPAPVIVEDALQVILGKDSRQPEYVQLYLAGERIGKFIRLDTLESVLSVAVGGELAEDIMAEVMKVSRPAIAYGTPPKKI